VSVLPRYVEAFLGRDDARRRLEASLDARQPVVVVGPGGVGKTRLAVEVAGARRGVRFCDLTPVFDRDALLRTVAHALDAGSDRSVVLDDVLAAAERLPRRLLLLDNAEGVANDLAELIDGLRRAAPDLGIVVTSRVAVPRHDVQVLALAPLEAEPARRLFLARVPPRPVHPIDPRRHARAIDDLCGRLEGLPLAIELAAARLEVLPLASLLERLDAAALRDPLGAASMTGSLERSMALLDPWQRDALTQLSVFRGTIPLDGAEAVLRLGSSAPLDALHGLVRHSLLSAEPAIDGVPRYRLLQVVREQVEARADPEVLRRAEDRHAAFFLGWAEGWLPVAPRPGAALAREEAEGENLEAIRQRAMATPGGSPRRRWALVALAAQPQRIAGRTRTFEDQVAVFEAALTADPEAPPSLAASIGYTQLAYARRHLGQLDAAIDAAERSVAAAEAVGSLGWQLYATGYLANLLGLLDERDLVDEPRERYLARSRALPMYERIVALAEEHGHPIEWSLGLCAIANVRDRPFGRWSEALALFEQALAIAEDHDLAGIARVCSHHVADARLELGQLDDALAYVGHDDRRPTSRTEDALHHYAQLATVQLLRGDDDAAERALTAATATADPAGRGRFPTPGWRLDYLPQLGIVAAVQALRGGRAADALAHLAGLFGDPTGWLEEQHVGTAHLLRAIVHAGEGEAADVDRDLEAADRHLQRGRLPATGLLGEAVRTLAGGDPSGVGPLLVRAGSPGPSLSRLALCALEAVTARAALERDTWFIAFDGSRAEHGRTGSVDLTRRRAPRAILAALFAQRRRDPVASLDAAALFESGWPGEEASTPSRRNRVYVALNTLRQAGLGDLIQRTPHGWRLDPTVPVAPLTE